MRIDEAQSIPNARHAPALGRGLPRFGDETRHKPYPARAELLRAVLQGSRS